MRVKLYCVLMVVLLTAGLSGCSPPANVGAYTGVLTSFGTTATPIGAVQVTGTYVGPISGSITAGSESPWNCTTYNGSGLFGLGLSFILPTTGFCSSGNIAYPATWDTTWYWNQPCFTNLSGGTVTSIPLPQTIQSEVTASFGTIANTCYITSETDTVPSDATPQVSLDTQSPTSLTLANTNTISSPASSTYLAVFNTSATLMSVTTATSVNNNGTSATFSYPQQQISSSRLAPGAYIAVVATNSSTTPETVFGMKPFFVGHNDTSFPEAFGVAAGSNLTTVHAQAYVYENGVCVAQQPTVTTTGGDYPIVTLPTENEVAIGTASTVVSVGVLPTAVVAYGMTAPVTVPPVPSDPPTCGSGPRVTAHSGPSSALVVNTGSNNVSLIALNNTGTTPTASVTGNVTVGSAPVAAVVSGTTAYVANWGDGTISQVNLSTITQTRTLATNVIHPSALWYDSTNGNIWVGGQGAISVISASSWSVTGTISVDGTVTSIMHDPNSGLVYQTILQNGSAQAPSNGQTGARVALSSTSLGASYSALATYSPSTGVETVQPAAFVDNSVYATSSLATSLAFPAQLALNPPTETSSSNGTFIATANGTNYSVIQASTGKVVVCGTLPYPIRSSALAGSTLYLTMDESNSVVSIPLTIP